MDLPKRIREQLDSFGARVRVGFPFFLRPFLGGFLAITLGRRIYLAPDLLHRKREDIEATLRHELAHVHQIARVGVIRFYWRYIDEYVRFRFAKMNHRQAYDAISFEREAREASRGDEGVLV